MYDFASLNLTGRETPAEKIKIILALWRALGVRPEMFLRWWLEGIDFSQARSVMSTHAPNWASIIERLTQNHHAHRPSYQSRTETLDRGPGMYSLFWIISRSWRSVYFELTSKLQALQPSIRLMEAHCSWPIW